MTQDSSKKPYVLGLDLGVQSVGWTVIELDDDDHPCRIGRTGVRCFDSGVGTEAQIEMGKDESGNDKRRQCRQQRRQLWRRAQRQRTLFRALQNAGLLPPGAARTSPERHRLLLELDAQLSANYGEPGDRIAGHLLPYRLRATALDQPLDPHALGRALYHLGQRRGFLSNRKAKKDTKEEGVVKAGIAELDKRMQETEARTLGEYLVGLDPEEQRIRGRWTSRKMYLDEFEALWSAQAPHHEALTAQVKKDVHRAIFRQRPLKSQKGLIGKCSLESGQRRAAMASLDAQRFRYWQKINDLEITDPENNAFPLSEHQRATLAHALENCDEITFAGMRTLLNLKKPRGAEHGYTFNLEAGGEKKLFGNRTAVRLSTVLGDRWSAMGESDRDRLVEEILSFGKEDALARRLERAWGFDAGTAAQVAAVDLEAGYASFSRRAMRKLLPRLQAGERLNTARKAVYGDEAATAPIHENLPPVAQAIPALRNPVVSRALTELRKVVNALISQYGKPTLIRVELARDMKRGRQAREDAWKLMRRNEKRREEAKQRILKETGLEDPPGRDILKVLLAEECGWKCPYTDRTIEMRSLVGTTPQFDIEHIIPFSRSLDDSFANKTLCYHEENRNVKCNRTPYEAYAGDLAKWREILQRVRRFQGSAADAKLRRFQMTEIPEEFAARQLNDTRYISRLAAEYLGMLFGGRIDPGGRQRVQVSTGRVTAFLRDQWGLNGILNDGPRETREEKNREDHRHHAVDAVAIGMASPNTIEMLSHAAQRAEEQGRRLFVCIDKPWDAFLDEIRTSIDAIHISYRVTRRLRGALHEETLYTKPRKAADTRGKETEYHHVRVPLEKLPADKVEDIVDPTVRGLVSRHLENASGDPKKAFADRNNHPYLNAKDGRIIPIHKVRIRRKVSTITVGAGHRQRYVAPGSNHHMEIVAVLDKNRKEKRWEGHIVSMFDAVGRLRQKQPVVQRDHGPGTRFKFSLAGGEYVIMEHQAGKPALYRVVVISGDNIEFRLHSDARSTTVLKKTSRARITRKANSLREANARKVTVDPLGNILPASD